MPSQHPPTPKDTHIFIPLVKDLKKVSDEGRLLLVKDRYGLALWPHLLRQQPARQYLKTKNLGTLRLLTGSPSGLLTSSFAAFGSSCCVTHAKLIHCLPLRLWFMWCKYLWWRTNGPTKGQAESRSSFNPPENSSWIERAQIDINQIHGFPPHCIHTQTPPTKLEDFWLFKAFYDFPPLWSWSWDTCSAPSASPLVIQALVGVLQLPL